MGVIEKIGNALLFRNPKKEPTAEELFRKRIDEMWFDYVMNVPKEHRSHYDEWLPGAVLKVVTDHGPQAS